MKILKAAFVLLLSAALCGCGKDGGADKNGGLVEARFTAGIDTRASGASWHPGDNVGITMLANDDSQTTILDGKHNRKYTTASGDGNFAPCEGHIYYPLDGTSVDFVGYYPYTENALVDYHKIPVNVAAQDYLPGIDVMTFERRSGSKNSPAVSVQFRHRLTKLIFDFTKEDRTMSKSIEKLEILGMNTTGLYDMVESKLDVDDSKADIEVPVYYDAENHTGSAVALVIPREAGSGVVFRVTLENEVESQIHRTVYEVAMPDELTLEEGYAYKFDILLRDKETPAVISATIVEWKEGGTHEIASRPLTIEQNAGVSEGSRDNDRITLYCGQSDLAIYTYNKSTDSWTPDAPVYWECVGDCYSPTVSLWALHERAGALNNSQMPEVALAVCEADRFSPIHLDFALQPAKVEFEIFSEDADDTREFTQDELDLATITLPDYIMGPGYDITSGVFTVHEYEKGDITVAGLRALIVPQVKKNLVAWVTIKGNRYRVEAPTSDGIDFQAGKVTTIRVNVTMNAVKMSASYADWTDDGTEIALTPVVTASGVTSDFVAGDSFALYYENAALEIKKLEDYTYQGGNVWQPATPVYWEKIDNRAAYDFYAVCRLAEAPVSSNQMDDWMWAECGDVTKFGLLDLKFEKQTSKIVVKLTSPDADNGYTLSELAKASITLPGYRIGGYYDGFGFKTGASTGNVTASKVAAQVQWVALIEEQPVSKGVTFIEIDMGGGNVYNVKAPEDYIFEKGVTNTFTVQVNKTGVTFSASYSEWKFGYEEDLETNLDV